MKSTMMMAKLGNMESAQSTEYLTSIINGFKLEAEDTQDVVSKLVSLDNAFATSTAEIASAMQRSSVSAQQAGVSMEELAAMITVVSDVSRRAPESIGESFKTMFARYQDILAGQVDEDGQGINNVGKALERVGVSIRDVDGGFRDFGEVLDELYPKWATLSEVEQANITKALAGVRQREALLILLENQTKYSKALEVQMDSEGLAAERYATYLDSVEASQNKLRASWESLISSSASSDMIKLFYNAASGVLEFINAIGGLPVVLIAAGAAYLAFSTTIVGGTSVALLSIASLQAAWTALLATNPMGWAVLAVAAIVMVANAIPTAEERLQKLNEEIEESKSKVSQLKDTAKEINSLNNEFQELSKKTRLTSDETQRLLDVQTRLKELVPEISGHWDEYGNFIIDATQDMSNLTDATLAQIEAQRKLQQVLADESANIMASELVDKYVEKTVKLQEKRPESEKVQIAIDWQNALEESKKAFAQMSEEGKREFISSLNETGYGKELATIFTQQMNEELANQEIALFGNPDTIKEQTEKSSQLAYESFTATLESLMSDDDTINSLFEKSMTQGLDFSDISKIPEEYLSALSVEAGKLKLNIDLIKEKQVAEAEMSLNAIKQAYERGEATAQEVSIIQLYYDNLVESQYRLINGTKVTQGAFSELAWSIAQNAAMSGNSFVDMQGKALNSAEAIYQYMSSGNQNFNDFVRQIANITGMTVQDVMNQINGMLATTAQNAYALENSLRGMSGVAYGGGGNYDPLRYAIPTGGGGGGSSFFTPAPIGYQYPGGLSDYSSSIGGGGGSNSQLEEQNELEDEILKTEQEIEEARKDAIDDLKDQLDVYKDIIDARKEIIDTLADEREYQQDVENKNKEILRVQNELATLQFDTSEEANARRLQLEEELANLTQELENIHYDQSVETQKAALDAEYQSLEDKINLAIRQIEGIQAGSLSEFASQLSSVLSNLSISVPEYHDGGVVGKGMSLKSNEMYAKLLKGEIVSTPSQIENFMNKTLPNMIQQGSSNFTGGNVELHMPVNINGNLDESAMQDLDKFAEKLLVRLQQMMNQRGFNRRADLFQT